MRKNRLIVLFTMALVLWKCAATETSTQQPTFYFDGKVDVTRKTIEITPRSGAGILGSAITLPYGGASSSGANVGSVVFHTCSVSYTPSGPGGQLVGVVQAVNNMFGSVTNLTVSIDSISATGTTFAASPSVNYGTVPGGNDHSCSANTATWTFTQATQADFTFSGHATGQNAVGQWPFDDGSGSSIADVSGNGNNATVLSAGTWTSGSNCHSGSCMVYNGSTSAVRIPYASNLKFGTGDFTVSAWMKTVGSGGEMIVVGANRCGIGESWIMSITSGKAAFATFGSGSSNGYITSSGSVNDGAWHFLVGTRSGTSLKLYVDGVQAASGSLSASFNTDAGGSFITVGNLFGCTGREFPGTIDEVRLYGSALTSTEINNLMAQ